MLTFFIVAIVAGFIDTLVGGGGLITVPVLLLSGVNPINALATNKLQGTLGTATATWFMLKKRQIQWHQVRPLMLWSFLGALVGTLLLQYIDKATLSWVIPSVLTIIAVYFLIAPKVKPKKTVSKAIYSKVVVPMIGCYDGFFGPGTGSFFTLSAMLCRGMEVIKSTALAKPMNFSSNFASLIIFISLGQVLWSIGFVMMLGQALGAWLGAHCLLKINPTLLRLLIVFLSMVMLVTYLLNLK